MLTKVLLCTLAIASFTGVPVIGSELPPGDGTAIVNENRTLVRHPGQEEEAIQYLNSVFGDPQVFAEAGEVLNQRVGETIQTFMESSEPYGYRLAAAVEALRSKEMLAETGAFFQEVTSEWIVTNVYTVEEYRSYVPLGKGCIQRTVFRDLLNPSIYRGAASITIVKPVVDNGFPLYSEENAPIGNHYLFCLVEEILHVAQGLSAGYQEADPRNFHKFFVSSYFRNYDIRRVPITMGGPRDVRELFTLESLMHSYKEIDVYARMLEMFGADFLPNYYHDYLHSYRQEVIVRENVIENLPPPGYEPLQ